MMSDFDKIIERRGTGALKTDALDVRFGRHDLTALWVADMDFATPAFIVDAIRERLGHPIFGYTVEPSDYRPSIIDWLRTLHGSDVRPEWISFIPGIVKGIGMAVNCFLKPDEKVVIMPPVYHPFRIVPEMNGREVVWWPLKEEKDNSGKSLHRYAIDFESLESLIDEKCKMLILSNPHNPAGMVWKRSDLQRIANFCDSHGILVISDEIHSEMVLPRAEKEGKRHLPFYDVSPEARRCSITFAAPSKTFNIAGIVSSYAIVPDARIRGKYFRYLKANELDEPTLFAPVATVAAYREGHEWRREMLEYVEGNIDLVEDFCSRHFDQKIIAWRPDASFLVWLDCRGLRLPQEKLVELFRDKARLALNDGLMFGPGGEGFMRLNVASPRSVILKALKDLAEAVESDCHRKQINPITL